MAPPEESIIRPIAHIRSDFSQKFGIPRQSGLIDSLRAQVVFLPEYREPEAFRGLEEYSHLWLIWQFSQARREGWSPTVRPPRLGGNIRKGVFATRSPFRPNSLGLSSVRLLEVLPEGPEGPVLVVGGADLLDGTPIYDVKPYLPYTERPPEALPSRSGKAPWRWIFPLNCWDGSLFICGSLWWLFWPRTPAPVTRMTRTGSTA